MNLDQQLVDKVRDELLDLHPEGVTDLFGFMATLYFGSEHFVKLTDHERKKDSSKVMLTLKLMYASELGLLKEKATA